MAVGSSAEEKVVIPGLGLQRHRWTSGNGLVTFPQNTEITKKKGTFVGTRNIHSDKDHTDGGREGLGVAGSTISSKE